MSIKDRFTTGRFVYWLFILGCVLFLVILAGAGHAYLERLHDASIAPTSPTNIPIVGPDGEVGPTPGDSDTTTPPPTPQGDTVTLALGQASTVYGIRITPKEVVEDSRCAADVECFWAGQVRIKAIVDSGIGNSATALQDITLGSYLTTEAHKVALTAVEPPPRSGTPIEKAAYRFTFTVTQLPIP